MRHDPITTSVILISLAGVGFSQTELGSISGSATSRLGESIAFVGDIDGDGHDEWVVGAPEDDSAGVDAGRARVIDGATGTPLYTIDGAVASAQMGASVDGAGLIDADSVPDIVLGSPGGVGRALVISGATGLPIWDITGSGNLFGGVVCGAGDVDGDGRDDFAAAETIGGELRVYSGATGNLIFSKQWQYGFSDMAGAGDWNDDGFDDIVVGNSFISSIFSQEGAVRVYLGPTGTIGLDLDGDVACLQYGQSVAAAGDVNGDGKDDILVGGIADACFSAFSPGRMDLLAGDSGALLQRWEGSGDFTRFGIAVAAAGDVDLDGVLDAATIEPFFGATSVFVYSGATGGEITTFHAPIPDAFPALAAGGDTNGDSYSEFLVGDPSDSSDAGEVEIWTYGCPPDAGYNVCVGGLNSAGTEATMGFQNSLSVSANNTRLFAVDAPANKSGLFFYGNNSIQVPFGDGFRCVGGNTFRFGVVNTGMTGTPTFNLDITSPPRPEGQIEVGDTWYFQFWYRDPMGPGGSGFNTSDALMATFCP